MVGSTSRNMQGVEETFMLARFTFRLLSLLGLGWRWNLQLWRLLLYACLLLPGFIQVPRIRSLPPCSLANQAHLCSSKCFNSAGRALQQALKIWIKATASH